MNDNWIYRQPVRVVFGDGELSRLPEEAKSLGCSRGLLVTSAGFVRRGLAQKIMEECSPLIISTFSDVTANPDVSAVDACRRMIEADGCDFVVAVGGGSVMDCAKAAKGSLPLIAVPTTAGTGSEITSVAVISDHAKGTKASFSRDEFFPVVAIVDPELTYSVPPRLTVCTGFDVICHAIEAYWSRNHQPVCDVLAVQALRLALQNLPVAYHNPDDHDARHNMAEASVVAGMAFAMPKTSAPHACSYPLTNLYGIPHGEACILTMPYFIRYNAENGDQRVETLARMLGFSDAQAFADHIEGMKKDLNMRLDLADFHLSASDIDALVAACHHPNLKNNPVEVTDSFLHNMFEKMC